MKHRLSRAEIVLTNADVQYLDGLLEAFNDLPQGAGQAACETTIAKDDKFKGKEPFDVWLAWALAPRPWEK